MRAAAHSGAPWRVVGPATALAVLLGIGYLLLPRMGTDLSAQVARADFLAGFGAAPVDFRWYGGSQQFGYSLVSPAVMAVLGVRPTGALALVASAALFALLLVRTGVPRPLLGGLVGALCIAGNLVSGRVTYALGVAFALAALVFLTVPARPVTADPGAADPGADGPGRSFADGRRPVVGRRWGWWAAGAAGLVASATSPVAGLFVGLVAAALVLAAILPPDRAARRDRLWDGVVLGVGAGLPLLVTAALFGEGGWMNTGRTDTVHAVVSSLVVAALVRPLAVRLGALLSALGILAAALVHTPVGLNATRLVVMFGLPVLAAAATLPGWLPLPRPLRDRSPAGPTAARPTAAGRTAAGLGLVALLAVGYWWQPPWLVNDFRDRGNPSSERAYFAPLLDQLARHGVTGRVEIPPTRDYWESAYLDGYPLARGWLRQVDIARNPLFFSDIPGDGGTGVPLTTDGYRDWLHDNAVQYVAVPDAPLSWVGRPEAALVDAGLPYLTPLWTGAHWRLYAVADPTPIVAAPAMLLGQDPGSLTLAAPAPGDYGVRVRYSRWLTVSGGATVAPEGGWTVVHVARAGAYTLSSGLTR